jgi:hypothetical protein
MPDRESNLGLNTTQHRIKCVNWDYPEPGFYMRIDSPFRAK